MHDACSMVLTCLQQLRHLDACAGHCWPGTQLSLEEDLEVCSTTYMHACMHVCMGAAQLPRRCADYNRSSRYQKLVSNSHARHLITLICILERLINRLGQQRDPLSFRRVRSWCAVHVK